MLVVFIICDISLRVDIHQREEVIDDRLRMTEDAQIFITQYARNIGGC